MHRNQFLAGLFLFFAGCSNSDVLPGSFATCADIQSYVRILSKPSSGAVPMSADASFSSSETAANLQEAGVDEADPVRIGAHQIFVAHAGGVEVVERKTLRRLGSLSIGSLTDIRLFTDGDRLIFLGTTRSQLAPNRTKLEVRWYRLAAGLMPELIRSENHMGSLSDARYVNGFLVLVMDDSPIGYDGRVRFDDGGDTLSGVACDQVAYPAVRRLDFSFRKVVSLSESGKPRSVAFLGDAHTVYMTLESIYVASGWGGRLHLSKVSFDKESGMIQLAARGHVTGWIKDRWAFKEYPGGTLSVATTDGRANQLHILREGRKVLKEVGASEVFGKTEDIRAIRYVGDIAYVVTFKKTDPLFAFDMKDPVHPKVLGELEIPGFSTYLHPISGGRMVGVGFDADDQGTFAWFQGIQISLFNIKDPEKLTRLDVKTLGVRGSYSDSTSDAHAFYFDPEHARIGVPIVELSGGSGLDSTYGNTLAFSGAVIYGVGGGTLEEKVRLTHSDWIPEACKSLMRQGQWWSNSSRSYDINRLQNLDGDLVSISRFGIRAHAMDNPLAESKSIRFDGGAEERGCQTSPYRYNW